MKHSLNREELIEQLKELAAQELPCAMHLR